MNTHSAFPCNLQWTSDQIADAVPLRLFELFPIDIDAADQCPAINAPRRAALQRPLRHAYLRPDALPALIRVRS